VIEGDANHCVEDIIHALTGLGIISAAGEKIYHRAPRG